MKPSKCSIPKTRRTIGRYIASLCKLFGDPHAALCPSPDIGVDAHCGCRVSQEADSERHPGRICRSSPRAAAFNAQDTFVFPRHTKQSQQLQHISRSNERISISIGVVWPLGTQHVGCSSDHQKGEKHRGQFWERLEHVKEIREEQKLFAAKRTPPSEGGVQIEQRTGWTLKVSDDLSLLLNYSVTMNCFTMLHSLEMMRT